MILDVRTCFFGNEQWIYMEKSHLPMVTYHTQIYVHTGFIFVFMFYLLNILCYT